jgi:hypothetical protein
MSLSKAHKANTAARKAQGKAPLSFAEYAEYCDRAKVARAARNAPKTRKQVKATAVKAVTPKFERVENRVDCFGTSKRGITIVGADVNDGKQVANLIGGKVVNVYTSKRGERARIETTRKINVAKLAAAGFTPKGF